MISIIVPVYNVQAFLPVCLDSIRSQDFQDIEIILVDDGSTDESSDICRRYAEEDPRIRYFRQPNGGLSNARNTGISLAKGEYLCFIDSDDLVTPDYCSTLLRLLELRPDCNFSMCGVYRFDDGTDPNGFSPVCETIIEMNHQELLQKEVNRQLEFGVCNRLFKRQVFDQLFFKEGKIFEDVLFAIAQAQSLSGSVVVSNSPKYLYRKRANSIVSNNAKKCSPDWFYMAEKMMAYCRNSGVQQEDYLYYSLSYPWSFVDGIYLNKKQEESELLLNRMKDFILNYQDQIDQSSVFSATEKSRMRVFARGNYVTNVQMRLTWCRFLRIIGRDPYVNNKYSI